VARAAGVALEPNFAPPRVGDVRHSQADVAAAMRDLGFAAEVPLDDGVAACLDFSRREAS
jgi:UDP-glucose 4-epimerase